MRSLRKLGITLLSLGLLALLAGPAAAVEPDEVLKDPVLEHRAREVSKELRCVVCQNQSIDESDAQLAKDMRLVVRDRLLAGDSDQEVLDYMVARYGDFVLLRPPMKAVTYALWFGPLLILALAGLVAFFYLRQSRAGVDATRGTQGQTALTEAERARLEELLARDEER